VVCDAEGTNSVSPASAGLSLDTFPKGVPMRRASVLLWLFLLPVALLPSTAQGAGDTIFAGTQVFTINIEFSQPSWWDSLTIYYNEGLERYIPATVTFNGVVYDSVGVRLKGNASYTHPNDKKPFRLSFDEYKSSQRLDGLKGVHLNNCWEDPTFMREKLHLDYCRAAGIPAPRGNFAELHLNGTLWGFYSLVEHVDKTFLSARYGNNGGNLYKAVDGLLGGPLSDFKWYGSDPSAYYTHYELKTTESPNPWTDLIAAIDSVNNTPDVATALPPVVNLDGLYRAVATDLLMSSLDSYAGSGRNFYIYFNPATGKMEWTIWDTGMSFGSYWGSAQNYETLSITYVSSAINRPLLSKIFGSPELQSDYLTTFCRLFTDNFSTDQLYPQIDALAPVIRPYVYADPRKMYTNEQFETNIVSDITVGGHRKPGLKSFIAARATNVASQLASLGVTCPTILDPGDVVINEFAADNTEILDPAGEAEDWIEMYNNTTENIALSGMYLSDDPALHAKWQFPAGTNIAAHGFLIIWADNDGGQEGLHANFKLSASGEYVIFSDAQPAVLDSVAFGPQTTNLTMSRIPNGTGPFLQGSPTFNAPNGLTRGDVVINEFAADNTLIPDPVGEMEDWIEMYNNTTRAIDLGGMYLSDTPATPTKWQFPDSTEIAPHGFLIIWADNNLTQPGLHANFKLSASGEYVIFSQAASAMLDSVAFGQQTTNLTMARVPNGTGPFVQGPPTFNASNGNYVTYRDMVINEFMASNTIFPDPAGEMEDWIELYNNTASPLELGGLYLSDDPANPTKWAFPSGTQIDGGGYLIVWADEDLDQEGLHAGFKLSSNGEYILMSNPNLSVVDSTSFGAQVLNVAMARIPNGTGPFVQTATPTPGGPNDVGSSVGGEGTTARLVLEQNLPNPFSRRCVLGFSLPRRGHAELAVFDLLGRRVATVMSGDLGPGAHRQEFDARNLPSGIYLCRLKTGDGVASRRMLVLR
jgi:spore coat protein CotH